MHPKYSRPALVVGILLGLVLLAALVRACARPEEQPGQAERAEIEDRPERLAQIERELTPSDTAPPRDGIAAVVLADVSSSMWTPIYDPRSRSLSSQIVIGGWAIVNLVRQLERHAAAHPDVPVLVGLFAFGGDRAPGPREVLPLSPPDPARTEKALPGLADQDGESIGNAMVAGTRALDQSGLTRRYLFVVTDGGNSYGYTPADVMAALSRRPEAARPSVYFIVFDAEAPRFDAVRKEGGQVLNGNDAQALNVAFEDLLTGKIRVERP